MARFKGRISRRDVEDPRAARRPAHAVLGVFGGGSPFGSTSYKTRRLCPFESGMVKVARLRPNRNSEPLDTGWITHAGWDAYYSTICEAQKTYEHGCPKSSSGRSEFLWGALREAEIAALDVVETYRKEPGYGGTYEDVNRIISAYIDHYRRSDWWHVLAVEETLIYEEKLETPVVLLNEDGSEAMRVTHFRYSARLDTVVSDLAPGREGTYLVEHKTTKILSEDLLHGYQQDMQILGQQWLFDHCVDRSDLPPFKGIVVNIASKHKTPKFERLHCIASPYHLQAFEESTRRWNIANVFLAELQYPKALGSCAGALRGYSRCTYYDLCHAYPERTIEDFKQLPPPDGFHRDEQDEQ